MKISELFGKTVKSTAGKNGYVISVYAARGELKYLICADENEKTFTVDFKNVKSVKDIIVFTEGECVCAEAEPLRLGKPAFDSEGNYLGNLRDFCAEDGVVTQVVIENKKFSAKDVVCGDALIIKNSARILKSDVKKNGKILFRRGTPVTAEVLQKARKHGEYVQTNLKTF